MVGKILFCIVFLVVFCYLRGPQLSFPDPNMADLLKTLEQLNLTQYASALKEGGYDDLESMISDFQDNSEELKAELVNEVGMKKPHSRKLLRHLSSLSQLSVSAQPPVPAADLGTKIMRALVPQNDLELDKKEPLQINISNLRADVLSVLSNISHESGSKVLSMLRLLIINIHTHPDEKKYKTITKAKLEKAANFAVPSEIMSSLGFVLTTASEGKKKLKYVYEKEIHEATTSAIVDMLDGLFVESRQLSQGSVHKPIVSFSLLAGSAGSADSADSADGGETKNSSFGGISWSQRHQAMAAARTSGMNGPMLSTDRLKIFLDELKARRNQMMEDGGMPLRKMKLFNSGGAEVTSSSSSSSSSLGIQPESNNEVSEVQQGEMRQGEEGYVSIDSSGTTMTSEVDEEARIEQQERMARQRLMNLRRVSEEKKRDKSNSFRSKASKKLEKMEQKELKFSTGGIKICEKSSNGISIMAKFATVENSRDVLDYLVDDLLSEEAQHLVENGSLELTIQCRNPSSSSSTNVDYQMMCSTSTAHLRSIADSKRMDKLEEMSMLEWNLVPRGRVILLVNLVNADGKKSTPLAPHLNESLREMLGE